MTLHTIKQTLLICVTLQMGSVFFSNTAQAQKNVTTSEIGIGIGGANYIGDLSPEYRFLNNQPALTVFYRRDLSNTFTARGGIMLSHRIADDNTIGDGVHNLPYPNYRQAEMRLSLAEVSLVMEYNFLDYYDMSQRPRISPYFFAGIAGLVYNIKLESGNPGLSYLNKPFDTNLAVSIPFGVGVKYALSKHWNLGLEFGPRLLFNDNIDYLAEGDGKHVASPYDKDWYFYNGISLSYTFYRINCPSPYRRQPGILD
jgi:opacity protein-like surface antigen